MAVGAVCTWRTGVMAALPSAIGLTILAVSDFRTRRIPSGIFSWSAASVVVWAAIDASTSGEGRRFVIALVIALAVLVVTGALWTATAGIAFGDVKLLALASFVPAWLGGSAVVIMLLTSLLAATGMIAAERFRGRPLTMTSTIPFGPPLLAGWLVGVLTA